MRKPSTIFQIKPALKRTKKPTISKSALTDLGYTVVLWVASCLLLAASVAFIYVWL